MSSPSKYKILDRSLKCAHCSHEEFICREILLNTQGLTLLGLDWLNQSAQCYACNQCGHLMWFNGQATAVTLSSTHAEATECLSCNSTIPANATECPNCGWSYSK